MEPQFKFQNPCKTSQAGHTLLILVLEKEHQISLSLLTDQPHLIVSLRSQQEILGLLCFVLVFNGGHWETGYPSAEERNWIYIFHPVQN